MSLLRVSFSQAGAARNALAWQIFWQQIPLTKFRLAYLYAGKHNQEFCIWLESTTDNRLLQVLKEDFASNPHYKRVASASGVSMPPTLPAPGPTRIGVIAYGRLKLTKAPQGQLARQEILKTNLLTADDIADYHHGPDPKVRKFVRRVFIVAILAAGIGYGISQIDFTQVKQDNRSLKGKKFVSAKQPTSNQSLGQPATNSTAAGQAGAGSSQGDADKTAPPDSLTSPTWVMQNGTQEQLDALLTEHPLNTQLPNGHTMLQMAVLAGRRDQAEHLLSQGANPNLSDSNEDTALHLAARYRQKNMCLLLLDYNADKNAVNNSGHTPRQEALASGDHALATILK